MEFLKYLNIQPQLHSTFIENKNSTLYYKREIYIVVSVLGASARG